ncbi:hypothetical protein [Niabella hibiscisoli]|uniref:hypothetical protein n=1 Tax=Niabella hibiscisoli TaxID=1825928 RepID=UPI001F0E3BC9|nr:hypothetical protein [Niabella hibiscisoli]MCH5721451.1 hypothetical protein [Niabella hibiscisoli]
MVFRGEQVGASMRYVELALKEMDLVYVEINAGDALLFHRTCYTGQKQIYPTSRAGR